METGGYDPALLSWFRRTAILIKNLDDPILGADMICSLRTLTYQGRMFDLAIAVPHSDSGAGLDEVALAVQERFGYRDDDLRLNVGDPGRLEKPDEMGHRGGMSAPESDSASPEQFGKPPDIGRIHKVR